MSSILNDNILLEKRKRSQVYSSLNHFITLNTYFDFFSFDAFKILDHAQSLAQSLSCETVLSEHLLLPFLQTNSAISEILKEYGLNEKELAYFAENGLKKAKILLKNKFLAKFTLPFLRKSVFRNMSISFSAEVNQIFEAAAENALTRFKTPVITSEILFITLMERRNNKASKYINQTLLNKMEWYVLRYKLLKRIHHHELNIRTFVPKNEHYFAYLLKTQIPEVQFDRLIENNVLALGVLFFRNRLLSKVRNLSLPLCLEKEIYRSIKITKARKYTF